MTAAYILMQLSATDPREMLTALRGVAGVKQAHLVAGPTDGIAFVEAADLDALVATLLAIRAVKGVASTDTRMAWPI